MTAQDPRTAFAFRAFTMAMKAKAGGLRLAEAAQLAELRETWIPGDVPAGLAVLRFLAGLRCDPVGAGVAFHAFLVDWFGAEIAAQAETTEAALVDFGAMPPPPHYDWQDRKDITG